MAQFNNPLFVAESPDNDVIMTDVSMLFSDAQDDEITYGGGYGLAGPARPPFAANGGATGATGATQLTGVPRLVSSIDDENCYGFAGLVHPLAANGGMTGPTDATDANAVCQTPTAFLAAPTTHQAAAFGKRLANRPPIVARHPAAAIATRGLARVGLREKTVLGPVSRTLLKSPPLYRRQPPSFPAFQHRHSPTRNPLRVFEDRPIGVGPFTSSTNRTRALHGATSDLFSAHDNLFGNAWSRYHFGYNAYNAYNGYNRHSGLFENLDNRPGPLPARNNLFGTNNGLMNHFADSFTRPSGSQLLPFGPSRKRGLGDYGASDIASMKRLRIDPPELRRQNRERLLGNKRHGQLKWGSPTAPSSSQPRNHSVSAEHKVLTTWTPTDQLQRETALADESRHILVPGSFPLSSPLAVPDHVTEPASSPAAPAKDKVMPDGDLSLVGNFTKSESNPSENKVTLDAMPDSEPSLVDHAAAASIPATPAENKAVPNTVLDNEPSMGDHTPMMSGGLAVSPNGADPREVVPSSLGGATIPADYTREPEQARSATNGTHAEPRSFELD